MLRENGRGSGRCHRHTGLRAARAGPAVLISTGDKDMAQLVNELDHAHQHDERLACSIAPG